MKRNAPVRKESDLMKDLATIHQYRTQEKRMTWREIALELAKANNYIVSEEALRVQYNRFKAKALEVLAEDIRECQMLEIQELKAELWNSWERSLRTKKTTRQKFKVTRKDGKQIRELQEENITEEESNGDVQYLNAYIKACDQEAKLVGLYTDTEGGDGTEVEEWATIVYPTKEEAIEIRSSHENKPTK